MLPGDQGTAEPTALWCSVLGCLARSLEGERLGVVSGTSAHGSPGSDLQPKEFCVQRISFAFRDKKNLCPQTPCLFRLAIVRWGSYGNPGILRQVRFPQPSFGESQATSFLGGSRARFGIGTLTPSSSPSSSPSGLPVNHSCAPVSRDAFRSSNRGPTLPFLFSRLA